MTNKPLYVALLSLSVLGAVGLQGCGKKDSPAAATAPVAEGRLVKVSTVEMGPAAAPITATGVGAYRDETRLSFKVGGVIKTLLVREGETVRKGQKLAELDLQEVGAALQQAQAGEEKARRDLQRGEELRDQEVITQVQLENLQTAAKVARAQLSQAQFATSTATIVAPSNGVVLKRFAQPAEVVAPGQPVVQVGSASSGFVLKAALADKDAVQVRLGQAAQVQFDALPGQVLTGKVIERSQAADPITGTYGLVVLLENTAGQGNLLSGLQGNITLPPSSNTQLSHIPLSAVVEGNNQQAWVFVLGQGNVVKKQPVEVAFVLPQQLALKTPLAAGTRVVSTGAAYLRDGEVVRLAGE